MPGSFWPTFRVLPAVAEPAEEDAEEDAEEGADEDAKVQRKPAARGSIKRPAASALRRPARADSALSSVVPETSPVIPRKRPADRDPEDDQTGKRRYGCGRCLLRETGCSTCRKEGFTPRGPRKKKASPAAPAAR